MSNDTSRQEPPRIKTENVSNIFNSDSFFWIPQFQRNYAWSSSSDSRSEDRHVNELLEDLWASYIENDKNYYLGTIITYKPEQQEMESTDSGKEFIIDGQQRITTLSFMLAAIYKGLKLAQDNNPDDKEINDEIDYIKNCLKKNINVRGVQGAKRIIASSNSNNDKYLEAYFENLDGERPDVNELDSQNNPVYENCDKYSAAVLTCDEWVLEKLLDKEVGAKKLIGFSKFVSEYVYFSYVPTNNFLEAYIIFERQNDRGAELLFSDIVKHFILSELAKAGKGNFNEAADEVNEKWQEIESKITQRGDNGADFKFDEFVRYFFISEFRKFLRPRGVIPWLKQNKEKIESLKNPIEFIEIMNNKADWFIKLRNNKFKNDTPNNSLKYIKTFLDSQQHLILMLAAMQLTKPKFEKIAKHVEALIFVTRWAETSPAKFEGKIDTFVNAIFSTIDPKNCTNEIKCTDENCLHRCFHNESDELKCKDLFEHEVKTFIDNEISNAEENIINYQKLEKKRSGRGAPMIAKYVIHKTEEHFRELSDLVPVPTFGIEARNSDGKALIDVDHILELNNNETQNRAYKGLRISGGIEKYLQLRERIGNLTLLTYHDNQNEFQGFTPKEKLEGKELLYCKDHEQYYELDQEECTRDRNKNCPDLVIKRKKAFEESHNLEITRRTVGEYVRGRTRDQLPEKIAKKFNLVPIKLKNEKHWTEENIIEREKMYFMFISSALNILFDPHKVGYKIEGLNT